MIHKFLTITILAITLCFLSCKKNNTLTDIGDSLTAGAGGDGVSMSTTTAQLLGNNWDVKNMGVGGENTLTIGARYGAMPMYINDTIILPKDKSKIEISKGLFSSYNDKKVFPLKQGNAGLEYIFINNIKCEISYNSTNKKYYINRFSESNKTDIILPKTIIETALSRQKSDVATIFIGQNGGYDSPQDFLNQIDHFVKHTITKKIIIITSHNTCDSISRSIIRKKYGKKHIDLITYMSGPAIYDAITLGFLPNDGSHPSVNDLKRMKRNATPRALLYDGVHLNKIGYQLLGRIRFQKGKELGYW